jgi:hypothetical protein
VKWFKVETVPADRTNNWPTWAVLDYRDTEISAAAAAWKISVGGDANKGTTRYKVSFASMDSPGALFRQNTVDDHRISDLVMRVVIKGAYATDYLKWASSLINVPFVDGSHPKQVNNHIGIDCADTAMKAWSRLGHPFEDISAQQIVERGRVGIYTLVQAPIEVYPDSDTDPSHTKWSNISRPAPGDLIMFDWPTMPAGEDTRPESARVFDHTTIFVSPTGGQLQKTDKTIYAGSGSTNYSVKDTTYETLWSIIQNPQSARPVKVSIIRLK